LKGLIIGTFLFFVAQLLVWFTNNGQFLWPWFKKNPIIIAVVSGTVCGYMFIIGTRYIAEYYGGLVWPGRFIGFSAGILSFAFLTWYFLGEGINLKTAVSLVLAILLIVIQLFWK
tara:strand:+ start:12026 stop:12370 length:345 start_codon:yes stop_codon:yes gene_type:complete